MTLATQFSLKSTESLQNRFQPHSGVTLPLSSDFNESCVVSIITALMITLGVNGPLNDTAISQFYRPFTIEAGEVAVAA